MTDNISPVDVTVAVEGTASPPAPPTNITATAVASSSRKNITEVGLSLRAHFTPFSLPPIEEVVAALHNTFPNEPGMIVQQLRGRGQGLFKVTLTSPIEDVAPYKATFTRHEEDIEIPITVQPEPSSGYRGQKTGTLVTLVGASSGPLATVQNDTFDKAMAVFGTVVKPTQHQNHRGTNTLNGNRYCVVDTKEKVIPGSIMVLSPATQQKVTVHLRYKGQTWFCRRCEVNHVGPCPFLQAFLRCKGREEETPDRFEGGLGLLTPACGASWPPGRRVVYVGWGSGAPGHRPTGRSYDGRKEGHCNRYGGK